MSRPRKLHKDPELRAKVEADLASGIKRGTVCETYGLSYQQLQREFGKTCEKPRKVDVAEVVT